MRTALLCSLVVALLTTTANLAGDKTAKEPPKEAAKEPVKEAAKPPKDSYVKVRVEIEVRGTLDVTDKGVTVAAYDRTYSLFQPTEEHSDWTRPAVYALDFIRAKDLRELAKVFHGKQVIVTGMAEMRRYVQKMEVRPGGNGFSGPHPFIHPVPTWNLQQTVLVTGLKSAENE